ncbi:MAG: peptidylprolyl isomerase [Blastocatellia bacterium]
MSKKWLAVFSIVAVLALAGFAGWQFLAERARASKLEAEILHGLSADQIELMLESQAKADRSGVDAIVASPEAKEKFLKGMKEYLALAAAARREGLTDDPDFLNNFEYKKNRFLGELYGAKLFAETGNRRLVSDDEINAVWSDAKNEETFSKVMNSIHRIQAEVAKNADRLMPVTLQGESLTKARESWATFKILSDKAKADAAFMQQPEIQLRLKVIEAGILSNDYLRKYWVAKVKATDKEIADYLGAHPEYDLNKKRQKAETILQRAKSGENFADLAKEFTEHRPTKAAGGLFENVSNGDLDEPLERAALALEPGQIAPNLIVSDLGLHIVKLEKKEFSADSSGNKIAKYTIRQILFQNGFEQPNMGSADIPAPFMNPQEIAKIHIENEKRNAFVDGIVKSTQISLPEDFAVRLPAVQNANQES